MKFRFITILHNLQLERERNQGIELFSGAYLKNTKGVLKNTILREPLLLNAGVHSIEEFNDKAYVYIDGELGSIRSKEEMDKIGGDYTFYNLRIVQSFIDTLWKIKDNNVYVRDGFLIAYNEEFEDGFSYKASLSAIFTYADLQKKSSTFTDKEIKKAINICKLEGYFEEDFDLSYDYKNRDDKFLYKMNRPNRLTLAHHFIFNARNAGILPMKIVSYCSALECLLISSTTEISHKIAERVAVLIGSTDEERYNLFKSIKEAYKIRSTIIHGSYLKSSHEKLINLSNDLDRIVRLLITDKVDMFDKSEDELELFFNKQVISKE